VSVTCKLCEKKRAKRHCPGVDGEICPACCGAERENTIDCPLDCEYLLDAREHERRAPAAVDTLPNADIKLNDEFLKEQEPLILVLAISLVRAMRTGRAVDSDAREALDALIRTYRTLESGLIYETRPGNPYAAGLQEALNKAIEEVRQRVAEQSGMHTMRDKDILGALVFLQRMELEYSNERRRGRAFMQCLETWFAQANPASVAL
jgi:hypothetical protein